MTTTTRPDNVSTGASDLPEQLVGASVPRLDAWEKVSGKTVYTGDLTMPRSKSFSRSSMLTGYRSISAAPGETTSRQPAGSSKAKGFSLDNDFATVPPAPISRSSGCGPKTSRSTGSSVREGSMTS